MATSSYKSFLMHNSTGIDGGSWEKLLDIKSYPNLGGAPEKLPTTTLSDAIETAIPGIQSMEAMEFLCNYTKEDEAKLKPLMGSQQAFAVWFGATGSGSSLQPTGSEGKKKFMGELSYYINGKGVNEVREMTVTITPSTEIEDDET